MPAILFPYVVSWKIDDKLFFFMAGKDTRMVHGADHPRCSRSMPAFPSGNDVMYRLFHKSGGIGVKNDQGMVKICKDGMKNKGHDEKGSWRDRKHSRQTQTD
jgi:hypothetical protein